jgi:hypothetical protein
MPICYTPDIEALPPLMQSPSGSTVGTPTASPTLCHRRIHSRVEFAPSTIVPAIDPCLTAPFECADYPPCSVSTSSSRRSTPRSDRDMFTQSDYEIAFLLKWFSEGPGYWMDLFDLGTYFASDVPAKARENPLLKYAAIACAAKALARVQGRKPILGGNATRQTRMEQYPDAPFVDWKHKAAVYYDIAVSLLLHALKEDVTSSPAEQECELKQPHGELATDYDEPAPKRRRTSSNASVVSSTDEILAASAILCGYEFMDTSLSEWAKHLNGAKCLLVLSQEQQSTPTCTIPSINFGLSSKAQRAIFWNIARQDMFAACKQLLRFC